MSASNFPQPPSRTILQSWQQDDSRWLVETIEQLVWITAPNGTIVSANPPGADYLGPTMTIHGPRPWLDWIHPEGLDECRRQWIEAVQTTTPFEGQYRLRRQDGVFRKYQIRGNPMATADGAIHCWTFCGIDLEHQHLRVRSAEDRILESIRRHESRFRKLANAMPQLGWIADNNGSVIYYNSRLAEYAGLDAKGDAQWLWRETVHPEELETTLELWDAALSTRTTYTCEHRIRMADGSYRWHLSRAVPVNDGEGGWTWFGTATDIHELKQAQEALRESDRRKDEFLAMLGHELRNPLAPILNGLELLEMAPGENREVIQLMHHQIQHVVRLVDDLLDVARIARGRIGLRLEVVDVQQTLSRATQAMRRVIDQRRQQLVVQVPDEPLWVRADPIRLAQVVENLLSNASKYTDEEGQIFLSLASEDDSVTIRVRDTGMGIEEELLPRIFDLFAQSSRSLDRSQGGLGIGLTLVKSLVHLHGGTINVTSEGAGQGSEFTVALPRVAAPVSRPSPVPRTDLPQRRVMIVDDNVGAAKMLQALLRRLGSEPIEVAHDGPAALEMASRAQPEIILLDIGLPGMDGYEVARRMRQSSALADCSIVALTGYGQPEDRLRSQQAGFDSHLVKPISADQLRSLLLSPPSQGRAEAIAGDNREHEQQQAHRD